MSQVPETHETTPAPLLDVEMLISNMHRELMEEARHAASIALRLRDSGQPWNQLIPIMLCILPELADQLGPVQVPTMPEFHQRPRWSEMRKALAIFFKLCNTDTNVGGLGT